MLLLRFGTEESIGAVHSASYLLYKIQLYLAKHFPPLISILLLCRYGTQSLVSLMYIIGRTISTDLQITELQQFFGNMLEEHQRLTVHAKLQTIKKKNLENKTRNARMMAWLRKNT